VVKKETGGAFLIVGDIQELCGSKMMVDDQGGCKSARLSSFAPFLSWVMARLL
jgi:hypothetical protein